MGRMLEGLKQAQASRCQAGRDAPALQAVWPEDLIGEGDVPFIEVGGSPAATGGTSIRPAGPSAAEAAPRLLTVQFRRLPLGPVPGPDPARVAPDVVAYHQPEHPISGQYRDLAGGVLASLPGEQARVLLFVSAAAGAGTTTVLLNTAVTLARQNGPRVLVVDAHLRRPAVAGRLGLEEAPGLREVLAGRLPLESAVRATGLTGLSALTAGSAEAAPPTRLAGEGMRVVLRQLREQFDLVLVDGPRWDGRPEVVALGCACDAVYLCLPEAEQNAPETGDLLQIIPEQGATLCGCILTGR
jgi:Mrp family chromosome partitioning ATPase